MYCVFYFTEWPSIPIFILAGVAIIGALMSILLTETKDKPLKDEIIRNAVN